MASSNFAARRKARRDAKGMILRHGGLSLERFYVPEKKVA